MQYKTTIEVRTEADNRYEAADIAGAFLRGEIGSGAEMKVNTVSVIKSYAVKTGLVICSISALIATVFAGNQVYYKIVSKTVNPVTSYAIQPPLRTNLSESQGRDFKNAWKKAQNDHVNSVTR